MEITPDGELAGHEIYESVIHSKARLVYDDISDMLENDDEEMLRKYSSIKEDLYAMGRLAAVLREKRSQRGSLDFDLDEAHIRLNDKGIPVSVDIAERRTANKLIEEFMLLANETVAEHFFWLEVPFIYRIHEKPAFEKVEQLKIFLQSMGMTLRGSADSVHPRELSSILKSVEGKPSEGVVNTVTLRSMQKAFYGTSCEGHFGLALKYYCHFTSPIRRYPDLMIHRIIKSVLQDGIDVKKMSHFRGAAEEAAEQSSAAERKAIEVEREVEKLKKAEYMSYHIGEVYDGIISGTTSFGIYVQLENTVEGMIRIEDLWDDYYDYVPEKYALVGEHTGRMYKLGDSIRIVVDNVDIDRHEIDFQLAE